MLDRIFLHWKTEVSLRAMKTFVVLTSSFALLLLNIVHSASLQGTHRQIDIHTYTHIQTYIDTHTNIHKHTYKHTYWHIQTCIYTEKTINTYTIILFQRLKWSWKKLSSSQDFKQQWVRWQQCNIHLKVKKIKTF